MRAAFAVCSATVGLVVLVSCGHSPLPAKECSSEPNVVASAPSSVASSSASTTPPIRYATLTLREVDHATATVSKTQKVDPTPFRDVADVNGTVFELGVRGLVVWDGKAFVHKPELEKGLHEKEGALTHDTLAVAGAYPDGLYVVTGRAMFGGRRLYQRTAGVFKDVQHCDQGTFNQLTVAPWGDGAISVCSSFQRGSFTTFGKAPPAPKLPRKKLAGKPSLDHDCLEPDTIFEPREVVVDGAQVLFGMHVCEEVSSGWARWSEAHKLWLPADGPSNTAFVQFSTVTLSGGVLTVTSKSSGPPLPVRLPDERARVLRWRAIGDTLWVVSSFRDEGSETTIHVSLATSAP